ncbi:amidase domain-containing protein [Fictibacillus nanhaiensis]|uniref:amidase domain-containing protein n=1 Tax=Fictibacillus nanhaiensis TaxID=742169 RepID=UPI001FE426CD|nr:amidase domain-containing protein [Fictibacillus nanhaiensis]
METLKAYIQNQSQWMIHADADGRGFFLKEEQESFLRKKQMYTDRNAFIVNNQANGSVLRTTESENRTQVDYLVHYSFLIKQGFDFYVEEISQERRAVFLDGDMKSDEPANAEGNYKELPKIERENDSISPNKGGYDRLAAVRYAERWWNTYNPAYKSFENDCTNYISQSVHAGGIPMTPQSIKSKGWWMRNNSWSYSWSVANAFRWYLSGSKSSLQAQEKSAAHLLLPGDVICYDFTGDGHYQHTTIVVAKDPSGEPLVNAHTTNSRMRYWGYEDSTAYTKRIQYKFFHIL